MSTPKTTTEWKLVPVEPTQEMLEAAAGHPMLAITEAAYAAMLAASPTPPEPYRWQPIETAPKDGTALLLWEEASIHPFVGWWAMGGWTVSHEHVDAEGGWDGAVVVDRLQLPITHWMPLPPAPGAAPPEQAAQPADVERLAPVAVVTRYGASVRLEWASVEAAHNAKPGPLFALAAKGAE